MITWNGFDSWDKYIMDTVKEQISEFKDKTEEYSENMSQGHMEMEFMKTSYKSDTNLSEAATFV